MSSSSVRSRASASSVMFELSDSEMWSTVGSVT